MDTIAASEAAISVSHRAIAVKEQLPLERGRATAERIRDRGGRGPAEEGVGRAQALDRAGHVVQQAVGGVQGAVVLSRRPREATTGVEAHGGQRFGGRGRRGRLLGHVQLGEAEKTLAGAGGFRRLPEKRVLC